MAKKFIQPGEAIDYTAGATLASGDVVVMGARIGIVLNDMVSGDVGAVRVTGVWELAKLSTDVIAQGALVYWDTTPGEITTTVGSNVVAGYAIEAAGSGTTTCKVKINA